MREAQQRKAIALCVEEFGTADGLCLDCLYYQPKEKSYFGAV